MAKRRTTTKRAAPRKRAKQPTKLTAAAEAIGRALGRTAAAVVSRAHRNGHATDAIGLLKRDHRRLEALLKRGENTTARTTNVRDDLLETITTELNAHELIEEKVLYPALKTHAKAKDIVLEGYQEHHVADVLVKELHTLARTDERWGAKFKVLKENIEHHIEEEEGDMFKKARSLLTREELTRLGTRMRAMKAEALRSV